MPFHAGRVGGATYKQKSKNHAHLFLLNRKMWLHGVIAKPKKVLLTVVVGLADDVLLHVVVAVLSLRMPHPSRNLAKKEIWITHLWNSTHVGTVLTVNVRPGKVSGLTMATGKSSPEEPSKLYELMAQWTHSK